MFLIYKEVTAKVRNLSKPLVSKLQTNTKKGQIKSNKQLWQQEEKKINKIKL